MTGCVRIGLFGGSFNPVHIGHLWAAEETRVIFSLEKVIFIPTRIAPHKPAEMLASPQHRLAMLKLAIKGNERFSTSDVELNRPGTSYSVETIRYFRNTVPHAEPFFIMGIDAFLEIDSWRNSRELFPLCNVIVMTRPGYVLPPSALLMPPQLSKEFTYLPVEKRYAHASGTSVFIADILGLAISSHDIRKRAAQGASFTYLVPHEVEEYIKQHQLYVDQDSCC